MGDGVSDLVKRGEGWASEAQKREAEDMALAQAAYRMAKEDLDFGRFAFDPRVVLSRVRAKLTQLEPK